MNVDVDWKRRALAAEETVRILKDKVRSMHGGGPQSALHRSLARAREREERNRRRREMLELKAAHLAESNERLEREVAERTRDIRAILDNVTFGFLRIDRDANVLAGFTRSCGELFGRMPHPGEPLGAILDLADTRRIELQLGIEQVFDDLLPEEVSLDQIPARYVLDGRVLRIEGRVIRDDAGAVSAVLVTVSDVTALERAQLESRERDVLIGVLRRKAAFEQFVGETRRGIERNRADLADQPVVQRFVHTVKGNAASWDLSPLTSLAHRIEDAGEITAADLDALHDALRDFLMENKDVLGVALDVAEPAYEIPAEEVRELRALLSRMDGDPDLDRWLARVVMRPAQELLGPIEAFAARLSERLGKTVDVAIAGGELLVDAELLRPVLSTVTQLVRNAMDHGIELPLDRGGKPARGSLVVRLASEDGRWVLSVADDGRGIQVERLAERAVEKGILTPDEARRMTRDEKVALIFCDGISTAAATTDVSGRGLGMSAVRQAVLERNGTISVETGDGGTVVRIEVPRPALAVEPTAPAAQGARP
jgi:two-component system chemotaxis sensor kinase CheA